MVNQMERTNTKRKKKPTAYFNIWKKSKNLHVLVSKIFSKLIVDHGFRNSLKISNTAIKRSHVHMPSRMT